MKSTYKKKQIKKWLAVYVVLSISCVYMQSVHAQDISSERVVRIALWAELDAYPGLVPAEPDPARQDTAGDIYDPAILRLKQIAPFIIEGMIYGWNFDYTPSDNLRGVKEFFSFTPIHTVEEAGVEIEYTKPWIQDDRLYVWAGVDRSESMKYLYQYWNAVHHQKITGKGYGNLKEGFDGVEAAYEEAAKEAVRSYERQVIKNKPKEVKGSLLLVGNPRLYVDSGKYVVDLDFFLEVDRIVPYVQF